MEGMSMLEGGAAGSAKVGQVAERDSKRQWGPGDDDRGKTQGIEIYQVQNEINGMFEQNSQLDVSTGKRKLDGATSESGRRWVSGDTNTNTNSEQGTHGTDDVPHARGGSVDEKNVSKSTVGNEEEGALEMLGKGPQNAVQMQAYQFNTCMNTNPTQQQGAIDRLRQQMGALESPVLLPIMQVGICRPSLTFIYDDYEPM